MLHIYPQNSSSIRPGFFNYYYVPGISHALLHFMFITNLQEGGITGQMRHSKLERLRNAPKITKTVGGRARISNLGFLASDHGQLAGSVGHLHGCSLAFESQGPAIPYTCAESGREIREIRWALWMPKGKPEAVCIKNSMV